MNRRLAHLIAHTPPPPGHYDYTTDLMATLLAHAGLSLKDGLVVHWTTPEEVATILATYQPHLVLVWEQDGRMLRALTGAKRGVDDLAGYVWRATGVCPGVKCIATYAPARVRQEWGLTGVCKFIGQRVARELAVDEVVVPERFIRVLAPWHGFTAAQVVAHLQTIQRAKRPIAHDLEGGCGMGPSCLGFATSKDWAVVVPIYDVDGVSVWDEEDEVLIWQAAATLLEDPEVPKIIQNAAYELFVLAWTTGIVVHGLQDDTMLKQFELLAELPKSLEFQAMLYTNQPYWKLEHRVVEGRYVPFKDGRRATTEEWYVYNGTDCCVTYEVNEVMEAKLRPQQRAHYQFNVALLTPLAYMALRGLRYDKAKAKARLAEVQEKIYELQDEINQEAAAGRPALKEFYKALESYYDKELHQGGKGSTDTGLHGQAATRMVVDAGTKEAVERDLQTQAQKPIIPLLTTAFCCCERDRKEWGEVEEVTWQPMRHNGKKWVKKGGQVKEPPTEACGDALPADFPRNLEECQTFYLAKRKQVKKRLPVEIKTLEDVRRFTLASKSEECKSALRLLKSGNLAPAQRGELSTLLGIHCNTESTSKGGDAQWFLYTHCGFEKQYAFDGAKKSDRLTTDTEALLTIWMKTQDPRCKVVLDLRAALTAVETLAADTDEDGRIRTSYNVVGTNTGRLSCSESMTGSGFNLQTVTKRDKDLFLADEGMELYSCDLAGADSWTVAAHAARHGDRNMLDDLLGKIKPAKIVALMQLHGVGINNLSREVLRMRSGEVPDEGGLYPASKATSHGSNYGAKSRTVSNTLLKQSYKKTGVAIAVTPMQCEKLQAFYFTRYWGVKHWQQAVARQLKEGGVLTTPFGFSRRFFGRKDDAATLREALSFEPQANTTWATNKMLLSLWTDPTNRDEAGLLIVEPLHQVHDAALFQGPVSRRDWIKGKVREWFDHPLVVGGVELTIPYEAGVGLNWKRLETL